MKLGIIGSPEAKTLVHAKELGLDFVEFDLNPSDFFGRPLDEITPKLGEIQAAMEETGVTEIRVISEDIFSLEILTVDGHEKRGVYVPSHLHLNVTYLLEADEAEVLRIKPDENSGVRWFSLEEALAACSEPWMIERVYKKLNAKVRERFGGTHGMQRGE